jgi:tetratricopeptide (TPR) repeat protein
LATAGLAAVLAAVSACAGQAPLDSAAELRRQFEAKSSGLGVTVEVPFQLADSLAQELAERYRPHPNELRRIDQVLDFIFGRLRLRYALLPTRDAMGTFQAKEGNCLSFVNLFIGVARHQRLNPFYVEVTDYQRWSYRDGQVLSQGHIVAGMYVKGILKTYDFLPYRPKGYRGFFPIDDLAATAHYYNNLAAEAMIGDDLQTAARHLDVALRLAPEFTKALNNRGVLLTRQGNLDGAGEVYRRALAAAPDDVAVLANLATLERRLGRGAEADEIVRRVGELDRGNPFFFLLQGQAALARNELAGAQRLLAEALRRDDGIAEVHVELAKTFLALGDTEQARHYAERALKLDPKDAEAQRIARLLSVRKDP